jgi:flagellar hook-associated protein 1
VRRPPDDLPRPLRAARRGETVGVNFSPFEIGRRALQASQLALTVTGQNIANVNTPGYTRQAPQLAAMPSDGSGGRMTGTGVTVEGVRSFRDRFIESRLQSETAITGRLAGRRDALAPLDAVFNEADSAGVGSAMGDFFGAFRDLEANPSSTPLRVTVVEKAQALATAFSTTRARLDATRRDADERLRSGVAEVNVLAARFAELNTRINIAEGSGGTASELRDQRGELGRQLAEMTGARAVETEQGMVTLTLGDGRSLVVGAHAFELRASSAPPDGLASLSLDGRPVAMNEGRLRGLADAAETIGGYMETLDGVAAEIVARVNTLHASGTDLDGGAGLNFFELPANGEPVTARNIAVSAALKADPRRVVASPLTPPAGAGTVAGAIANLLTDQTSQIGTRSGSLASVYGGLVQEAGSAVADADNLLVTQEAILAQANAQRDAVSGVSLDEEAVSLLQYQRAYEAAARFLKVADEMTQTVFAIIG